MTRNHQEPYQIAGLASVHGGIARQKKPLDWARSVHTLWTKGDYRPRKDPGDADKVIPKIRATVKPELIGEAIATIVRGENELRLRALIRAQRLLAASADKKDQKYAAELSSCIAGVWGITRAHEQAAEGEVELSDRLREEWGNAQLPPADATVNQWSADEILIVAAVRRLK